MMVCLGVFVWFAFSFFFLMRRRPPRSKRTDTLFPYTTLFRSELGSRFRVAAVAADGVIEAIEAACGAPVLGVQWHPEMEAGPAGDPLWRWLVEAAEIGRAHV